MQDRIVTPILIFRSDARLLRRNQRFQGPERPTVMIAGEPAYLLDRINYLADPAYAGRFDPNPMHSRSPPGPSPVNAKALGAF